jgi:hypothetical protein
VVSLKADAKVDKLSATTTLVTKTSEYLLFSEA